MRPVRWLGIKSCVVDDLPSRFPTTPLLSASDLHRKRHVALAKKHVIVQHCLPAYRDQEITEKIFEERQQEIFDQAENRLHAQKGIMHWLSGAPAV